MTFGERVVGVMKADVKAFEDIEGDKGAMGQAVTVILLVGVAALIANIGGGLVNGVKYLIPCRDYGGALGVARHGHRHQADARADDQGRLQ